MVDLELKGKVAIVTGGGQGIGRGIAQRLLAEGMRVAIAEIDAAAGAATARELSAQGEIICLPTDVTDEQQVARAVEQTLAAFGRIDGLVANAGIANPNNAPLEQLQLADWNRLLATNLTGPLLCARATAAALRSAGGAIVNIASTRALQSEPDSEAYAASKGGLLALTHALASSLGPQVRVNAISPGWIDVRALKHRRPAEIPLLSETDHAQHPAGRVGEADDIAALAAFLLSPRAGFITGQNYVADGGMTRRMIYID